MSQPKVSVVVVSRGRVADLPLCLIGLSQLDYPSFEIVLVADPEGIAAVQVLDFVDQVKQVTFDEPNISAARNLGIAQAAGDIVAFIDDDAVAEPTWLTHLMKGFEQPEVACAGGFVIGRNGISFQWKARRVNALGEAEALDVSSEAPVVIESDPGWAVKTEGTNMALRRDVLVRLGGFDPAYRFFLDETDVNLRLTQAGLRTAICPLAQVHHGYKASAMRHGDRVPRDLFEIGASLSVFLRKHAEAAKGVARTEEMRREQERRLLSHVVNGGLEPRDVGILLGTFDAGVREGKTREVARSVDLDVLESFRAFRGGFRDHRVFAGRIWQRRRILDDAGDTVRAKSRVSVFLFSPTARPHRVAFRYPGVWVQSGGLFGRSLRTGSRFKWTGFRKRLTQELRRVSGVRGLGENSH